MGMFDKDKEVGLILTSFIPQGEQFILWDAKITREDYPTRFGPSAQATLVVSLLKNRTERLDITTVATAIVNKVREAESDDFPALVMWRKAPSDRSTSGEAIVLQFIRAWGNTPDQVPAEVEDQAHAVPADDDIPF